MAPTGAKIAETGRVGCAATSSAQPTFEVAVDVIMPTSVGGPQLLSARQGRELQRYSSNGERLVAGWVSLLFL